MVVFVLMAVVNVLMDFPVQTVKYHQPGMIA
jgi:hypothetical protein